MITGYEVVIADSVVDLERRVLRAIDHGWELVGGVAISHAEGVVQYAQAIIKRGDG